jgi:uncharacterized protein (TIGR02444 family)
MIDSPSAFWDFSLHFYARPGVAPACLELQDRAGADVNVILYLFFLATQSRRLDDTAVAALDETVAAWREQVVRPLRMARRHLKSCAAPFTGEAAMQLRGAIKRNELDAEHLQQLVLEQMFPPHRYGIAAASPAAAIRASLDAYGRHIASLPAAATETLITVFNAPV